MAMSTGFTPSKARKHRFSRSLNSDINVTPFVDVMLVLLIIFMVTAPMMTVGVPLDLPQTKARDLNDKTEPLTISVTQDGQVHLMDTAIDIETLVPKLQAILESKPDSPIYIRGDQSVQFGRMMEVMGRLNMAGIHKVALLAQLPKDNAAKKP